MLAVTPRGVRLPVEHGRPAAAPPIEQRRLDAGASCRIIGPAGHPFGLDVADSGT
jgi:hypothetical protein